MSMPNCSSCGVTLKDPRSKSCKSCSKKGDKNPFWGRFSDKHHNWRGGYITKSGYKKLKRYGRVILEHRWVVEQHLGRQLSSDEIVHHINGIKTDNRIENLQVMSQSEHVRLHKPMLGKYSTLKRDPITQRFSK